MHNLLADNFSGADAIAITAMEYGLVDTRFVSQFKAEEDSLRACCLQAARQVLNEYFEPRKTCSISSIDIDQLWFSMISDARRYLLDVDHDCSKFAPVIFDLMLQQIRRYP